MDEQFEELDEVISFEGFDCLKYFTQEDMILRPRLEEAGFHGIHFSMGEADSFGPLTRICTAIDKDGKRRRFIYG